MKQASMDFIGAAVREFSRPAILCSFGKDSLVLLALTREMGLTLPVIFYKEPYFSEKYFYAHQLAKAWNLEVLEFPPVASAVFQRRGQTEIMNAYSVGGGKTLLCPTGITETHEGEYLCGLRDLLLRQKSAPHELPFDALLIGHKSTDIDPLQGELTLHADRVETPGASTMLFPMRHWTDEDVWEYIEANCLPIHRDRYEKVDGHWKEKADKTFNPDYMPACTRCLDKSAGDTVFCPKSGRAITNPAARGQVPTIDNLNFNYYGTKQGA